jgi:hypothetical protein
METSEMSHAPATSLGEAPTAPIALGHVPAVAGPDAGPPPPPHQQCDECGAPVDTDQRYCVTCGAHRRHVNDPAARYLSARSQVTRGAAAGAPHRPSRAGGRSHGLGIALILALIPVIAAVGVAVGRSSNNNDAKLIQALSRHQAAAVTGTGTAAAATATSATTATARPQARARGAHHGKARAKHGSAKKSAAASSTTQFGSVSQITGTKPTKAQEQQGAQDTQKVQKSTGKTYVNGQSSLPGTVVVP